jgi:uncharacterized protein involved in exopolysaccharide biosynthesis
MNYYNTTDPELAMLNNQLQREVEVKSQVYLTLCQQYELASIQEKKEIPVIQILDSAQPPTIKSGKQNENDDNRFYCLVRSAPWHS